MTANEPLSDSDCKRCGGAGCEACDARFTTGPLFISEIDR